MKATDPNLLLEVQGDHIVITLPGTKFRVVYRKREHASWSFLSSKGDERKVIADPIAQYFGAVLDQDGLAPSGKFISGPTRFADWARA